MQPPADHGQPKGRTPTLAAVGAESPTVFHFPSSPQRPTTGIIVETAGLRTYGRDLSLQTLVTKEHHGGWIWTPSMTGTLHQPRPNR